jgi:hypothetical protein
LEARRARREFGQLDRRREPSGGMGLDQVGALPPQPRPQAAPRVAELHPATPRVAELHPKAPRVAELHPAAARVAELHPAAPRVPELHPAAPRVAELHPATAGPTSCLAVSPDLQYLVPHATRSLLL